MLRTATPANTRLARGAAVAVCCSLFLAGTVASSPATPTRASKIPFSPEAVGSPPQRGVGHVTVRTPPGWGRWSPRTGAFTLRASPTCNLSLSVGAGLATAASPTRRLHIIINPRNGGEIVSGKTSTGGGVWGAQIYGPGGFQLEGITVVKLAPRRMAELRVQLGAEPSCHTTDHTEVFYGPVQHMLRTARFHVRLKTA